MSTTDESLAAVVHTSQGDYRVLVGRGVVDALGDEFATSGLTGRAFIVGDQAVFPAAVRRVQETLESSGIEAHVLTLPSGEPTKNLDTLRQIYAWLAKL